MFKIRTDTGTYKVQMRASYSYIRSEKAFREQIQKVIDGYSTRPEWKAYSQSLQEKLDADKLHDIASLHGYFTKSIRIK